MSSSMKAYLAEKYMSGPKADAILSRVGPQKKKKRKAKDQPSASTSSFIKDDDVDWGNQPKDDEDDLEEAVVASDRGFKKRKTTTSGEDTGWITLKESQRIKEESPPPAADEQPMVVDEDEQPLGGLMTSTQLKKVMPHRVVENTATKEEIAAAQETVYRDASGRKIDTKAARAEAARKKREQQEKEAAKMEWGKGLVQRDEEEKKKQELEKLRNKPFARHADDTELNEELKSKELWNDPAAAFLTKKKKKGPRRPEYTGPPPPPNRFGIKPGYRWDGVDRGNGFEKKLFQNRNSSKRNELESYQWSVDDM